MSFFSISKKAICNGILVCILCLFLPDIHAGRIRRSSFQTEHFVFSIDKNKAGQLPKISGIFEASYQEQTRFYEFKPEKKIYVLLIDEDDIANGAAYVAQGWVVIFLPGAQFPMRGRHAWLPNVIAQPHFSNTLF